MSSVGLQEASEKGRKVWATALEQEAGLGLGDVCHCKHEKLNDDKKII